MIISGTGHRPDKLGGYGDDVLQKLTFLARDYLLSQPATVTGALTVISGMALGWDTALALAALELGIPVTAAIPFLGQERKWPTKSQQQYREIMGRVNLITVVCEGGYAPEKMQERNEWMVDECDRLCALWDGSPGGTANCIRYAKKFKKPIDNLWDQYNG